MSCNHACVDEQISTTEIHSDITRDSTLPNLKVKGYYFPCVYERKAKY